MQNISRPVKYVEPVNKKFAWTQIDTSIKIAVGQLVTQILSF